MRITPKLSFQYKYTTYFEKAGLFKTFQKPIEEVHAFRCAYILGLDGKPVDELSERFYKDRKRVTKQTTDAMKSALYLLAQCHWIGQQDYVHGFLHSFSYRRETPKAYREWSFNREKLADMFKWLKQEYQFVDYHLGRRGKEYFIGLKTLLWATPAFSEWYENNKHELTVISLEKPADPLVLKVEDNNGKRVVRYKDTSESMAIRQRIEDGNKLRASHEWSFRSLKTDDESLSKPRAERDLVDESERQVILAGTLNNRRIFNGTFYQGGRLYSAAQGLSKRERETIQIDGEQTIELDYVSLHPRLMYHSNGLYLPEQYAKDCYAIACDYDRSILKKAFMYISNARGYNEAVSGLASEYRMTRKEAKAIFALFEKAHSPIANQFFQSSWMTMQYLDSQIADRILLKGVNADVPILSIHDSFIVRASDSAWLFQVMQESYKEVIGDFPVEIDVPEAWQDAEGGIKKVLLTA